MDLLQLLRLKRATDRNALSPVEATTDCCVYAELSVTHDTSHSNEVLPSHKAYKCVYFCE